ncbi:hypothetical protein GCM10009557_01240 [Virgisporangium ochraceum]
METSLLTPLLVMILLLVVLCGRLASVQLDLDAAASAAARAGSLARTEQAARTDAERAARDTLAARSATCTVLTVTVTTDGQRPGSAVTVTLSCQVPLADLLLLGVPGSRTVEATATSPVDVWRGVSLEFSSVGRAVVGKPPPRLCTTENVAMKGVPR